MPEGGTSWFVNLNVTSAKLAAKRTPSSKLISLQPMSRSQNHIISKRKRPGGVAVTISTSNDPNAHGEEPKEVVCADCRCRYEATTEALALYREMLLRAKELFLQDTLHHHSEEDIWPRLFRALGGFQGSLTAPTTSTDD